MENPISSIGTFVNTSLYIFHFNIEKRFTFTIVHVRR